MGRWLGFSESYVDHTVLPAMREAGVVETEALTEESGRVTGLAWKFLPLVAARASGNPMHPLALTRKDLATLLRFCEALFAPGWAPKDGPVTPPGILAARKGRGAATDRLALLLLALQTRPDGRVRLIGGPVKEGRGRADATVAKALGCSVSGGAKVVDRLEALQVVDVVRQTTATGHYGKGRLIVPAIAAAAQASQRLTRCPSCAHGSVHEHVKTVGEALVPSADGRQQKPFTDVNPKGLQRPATAPGDLQAKADTKTPLTSGKPALVVEPGPAVMERPVGAPLHTDHTLVVPLCPSLSVDNGFSGEADLACRRLPKHASTREIEPVGTDAPGSATERWLGNPLRGEHQQDVAGNSGQSVALRSPKAKKQQGEVTPIRPSALPEGLESVLAPVRGLWARITRPSARRHIAAAIRGQLGVMRGIIMPHDAERVLAARLERRLDQQMGQPVTDPVGWILGRGLIQRMWCWSQLCDEGRRMDSGADCPSCQTLVGDRREQRARISAETVRELLGVAPQMLRAQIEKRLNTAVTYEAAAQAVRRERAAAEQQARAQILQERRAQYAAAEQERLAAPCADCGIPEAAGRCLLCTVRRAVERTLAEAVDFAVMARADLTDVAVVADATKRCAADTEALLGQRLDRLRAEGIEEGGLLLAAREIAQHLRDRRRASLNGMLMLSDQAQAEADQAYRTKMRAAYRFPNRAMAEAAADRCADEALGRAVEYLGTERARQLRIARGDFAAGPRC
ncbi:hypothetical protein ABZ667_41240 [Streptomyces lavendulae]|uniref:hypothetical protein n=1 Tax=Streptomyces lavendulae TaxID=1914 RepID=UPI003405D0F9